MVNNKVTKPEAKPSPRKRSGTSGVLLDKHHEFLLLCIEESEVDFHVVSKRLGISVDAARMRLHRLKTRLREMNASDDASKHPSKEGDTKME